MEPTMPSSSPEDRVKLLQAFLAAEGREKKVLLQRLAPLVDRDTAEQMAPAIRDPSPRISTRVTSVLARFDLREAFEAQLPGLKTGKIDQLRAHFRRIQSNLASDSE